jgi:GNAT superfamily N-acetyltransferase
MVDKVRNSRLEDYPSIARINNCLAEPFLTAGRNIPSHIQEMTCPINPDFSNYNVAVEKGRVVGGLKLVELDDDFFIDVLAVDKRHRGVGVGASLVDFAVDEAYRRGFDFLSVGAWRGYDISRFYEKMGFCFSEEDGEDLYFDMPLA